jgi:hypothetical protein
VQHWLPAVAGKEMLYNIRLPAAAGKEMLCNIRLPAAAEKEMLCNIRLPAAAEKAFDRVDKLKYKFNSVKSKYYEEKKFELQANIISHTRCTELCRRCLLFTLMRNLWQ